MQVQNNKAALEWGRRCAHDMAAVTALFQAAQVIEFVKKPSLDDAAGARPKKDAVAARLQPKEIEQLDRQVRGIVEAGK